MRTELRQDGSVIPAAFMSGTDGDAVPGKPLSSSLVREQVSH